MRHNLRDPFCLNASGSNLQRKTGRCLLLKSTPNSVRKRLTENKTEIGSERIVTFRKRKKTIQSSREQTSKQTNKQTNRQTHKQHARTRKVGFEEKRERKRTERKPKNTKGKHSLRRNPVNQM